MITQTVLFIRLKNSLFSLKILSAIVLGLGIITQLSGMTFDNRFLPLIDKNTVHENDCGWFLRAQPIYMFAQRAFAGESSGIDDGDEIALFNLYGNYDQRELDNVLSSLSFAPKILPQNDFDDVTKQGQLIPPSITAEKIPWSMPGRIDAVGSAFHWAYRPLPWFELGGTWIFLGIRSRLEFLLQNSTSGLFVGTKRELLIANQEILDKDNVSSLMWDFFGSGDLDIYTRISFFRKYFWKMRTVDWGLRCGVIVPSAQKRDLYNLASISLGGDGHWGAYAELDLESEVREDWFAGLSFRGQKRFAKDQLIRMPVLTEPQNVAAVIGVANVDPGWFFMFSPYVEARDFNDGFGFSLKYTLSCQYSSDFTDRRFNEQIQPVNLDLLKQVSRWNSEYVTCTLSYDWGHNRVNRGAAPMLLLDIDVPVNIIASKRSAKTYGVSLRIESEL